MEIQGIEVRGFKRTQRVDFSVPKLTILIGGNNSGKSSLLQGIHFALTVLQSAKSSGEDGKSMSTLGYDQFIYRPTADLLGLNHGSPITSKVGPEFTFAYSDDGHVDPQNFSLVMRRGKNANISIAFDQKSAFFARVSDRTQPFSIFVPGLAGVPLREERRTPSIVTNGIAQGDSNLYLRNVLLDIIRDNNKIQRFHEIIRSIFPGLRISSPFDENIHLYIEIKVELNGKNIALEMVGTGCLQVIQLVAYVTAYDPALLLLDEPDAHLHPSNQRALAATLKKISENGNTKVIIASHSRHIFDALTADGSAQVIWMKDGDKKALNDVGTLSILLDLGALDSYEMIANDDSRVVLLTEDTKTPLIKTILQANGLDPNKYFAQAFHGVDNISSATPIAEFFLLQGNNTKIILHRDGDAMLDPEKEWWKEREAKKLPDGVFLFVTPYSDVEHSFCQPAHIAAIYDIPLAEAEEIVASTIVANAPTLTVEFTNKRNQLKTTALKKLDPIPAGAQDLIDNAGIKFEQVKGKTLIGLVSSELAARGHNPARLREASVELVVPELQAAIAAFGL